MFASGFPSLPIVPGRREGQPVFTPNRNEDGVRRRCPCMRRTGCSGDGDNQQLFPFFVLFGKLLLVLQPSVSHPLTIESGKPGIPVKRPDVAQRSGLLETRVCVLPKGADMIDGNPCVLHASPAKEAPLRVSYDFVRVLGANKCCENGTREELQHWKEYD